MARVAVVVSLLVTWLALAQGYRRVCYHTNWSQYRPGTGKFIPENINPMLCTNIMYSFATMTGNQLSAYEWNDDSTDWSVGMYEKVTNLKYVNPDLRVSLAVGGWNFGVEKFSAMLATAASRAEFVSTSITYLRQRNFDGLDLDFEFPGSRGSPAEDKQNYASLVQELRAAFNAETIPAGKERLLLSAAVPAGKDNIDNGYDIPVLNANLDWISVMSYDLNGAWDTQTGLNSPLYPYAGETGNRTRLNIDWAVNYWVANGASKSKLVVGLATYGRCFQLTDASQNGLGAPVRGPCTAGDFTREAGFLSYYEICALLNKAGTTAVYASDAVAAYLYNGDQWVGYDNPQSLTTKVQYVKDNGYSGWLTWAVDLDDFAGGSCGQGNYPLMSTMNLALEGVVPTVGTTLAPTTTTTTTTTTAPYTGPSTTAPPTVTTTPNPTNFCSGKADGIYSKPGDCTQYYHCSNQQTSTTPCSQGLYFNPANTVCDWPANLDATRKAECGVTK